jgi:hypothetical protein
VVVSIVRTSANPSRSSSVQYRVTFSAAVSGVDLLDFCLNSSGLVNPYVSSVSGSGLTRNVTVKTGTGDGTLRLDVCDNDTILNGAGTPLGGPGIGNGDFRSGEVYTIDRTRPTVVLTTPSLIVGTAPIPVTATFSEPVSGFVASDLTVTNCTVSNFAAVSGSLYTFELVPTVPSGTVTVKLNSSKCDDQAGNGNLASNLLSILFDGIPPTVTSSTRLSANPTRASTVKFLVTFSESVTGVDAGDFSLATTGSLSGVFISAISGSNATRTVTVNTGTGDGTLRLDVTDNDSIVDLAGNRLGGTGAGNGNFTGGQTYTVDRTRPTVVLSSTAPDPTNTSPIPVVATFSEPVFGFVASDVSVTNATVTGFAGSGAVYTFNLVPQAPGTVTARVPAGRANDAAGNDNRLSNTLTRTYQP